MSQLVGDVIMAARDLMLDPPQTFPTPSLIGAVLAGGTIPIATWYVVVTLTTPWGETMASNEVALTTTAGNQTFQLNYSFPGDSTRATSLRVYFGLVSGGEQEYNEFPLSGLPDPLVMTAFGTGIQASPPPTNSAYLPDTDGNYLRASTLFRWLNDALRQSSRLAGGLPDYSGFPSTINWATYIVTGEWVKMTDAWYDGYPVAFATSGSFFKRNNVTSSILAGWAVAFYDNRMGVELWPQPARTATQTTLSSPMLATDTTALVTSTFGFLLPTYGMVQIGSEICAYNSTIGGLQGLVRGLGGTAPAAWPAGTVVKELNAFFKGRRVWNTQYSPGQSSLNLPLPAGWDGILNHFLMSKYYETERDAQNAARAMKEFQTDIQAYVRMNRSIVPHQAGDRDYQFVVFGGTRFGGNVIP